MRIVVPFFSKTFSAESKKKAYEKTYKWIATNIVKGKDEIGETLTKIEEDESFDFPTFKLTLYCMLDEKEDRNKFCNVCKAHHKSFFVNQDYNCSSCNVMTYVQRLDKKLSIKRQYRKERLHFRLNKDD